MYTASFVAWMSAMGLSVGCGEPLPTGQRTTVEIPSERAASTATTAPTAKPEALSVTLPSSTSSSPLLGAPLNPEEIAQAVVIMLRKEEIWIDGTRIASRADLEPSFKAATPIPTLEKALRERRQAWKPRRPSDRFHASAILEIETDVPAALVKSAFQTAAYAGYHQVAFRVSTPGD